jgi:hypothetical protein
VGLASLANLVRRLGLAAFFCAQGCMLDSASVGSNKGDAAGGTGGGGPVPGCDDVPVGVWQDITPPGVDLAADCAMQDIAVDPFDSKTLWLATCMNGFWKSPDCGASWQRTNTGTNGRVLDDGSAWSMVVDPVAPDTILVSNFPALGIFKSTNGGVDWKQLFAQVNVTTPINASSTLPDIYSMDVDPADHLHLIAGFHGDWVGYEDGGVIESTDGGATWELRPPAPGMGSAHCVFFLNDGASWLTVSMGDGSWRTGDHGATWERVSEASHLLTGCQIYRSPNGYLYHSGSYGVFRSMDNGMTWTPSIELGGGVFMGLVGDGEQVFASLYIPQDEPVPYVSLYVMPETPGDGTMVEYDDQTFAAGAKRLAVDRGRRLLYSSNFTAGAFRLRTEQAGAQK